MTAVHSWRVPNDRYQILESSGLPLLFVHQKRPASGPWKCGKGERQDPKILECNKLVTLTMMLPPHREFATQSFCNATKM